MLKTQQPCRKCPSAALTRGSPAAVTLLTASVHMPVMTPASWAAVRVRPGRTIDLRCPVDRASEASSRA